MDYYQMAVPVSMTVQIEPFNVSIFSIRLLNPMKNLEYGTLCLTDLGDYVLDQRKRLGIKVVSDMNESQSGYLFAFSFRFTH